MDFELRFDVLVDPEAFDDLSENEEEGNDREKLEETFEHEAFDDEAFDDEALDEEAFDDEALDEEAFTVANFLTGKSFRGGMKDLFDELWIFLHATDEAVCFHGGFRIPEDCME